MEKWGKRAERVAQAGFWVSGIVGTAGVAIIAGGEKLYRYWVEQVLPGIPEGLRFLAGGDMVKVVDGTSQLMGSNIDTSMLVVGTGMVVLGVGGMLVTDWVIKTGKNM